MERPSSTHLSVVEAGLPTRILADAMTPSTSSPGRPSPLRMGVAGLGAVAQSVHLPLLARLPDRFRIAAVCDLSRATRETVGDRYGVPSTKRHESLEQMLAAGGLDGLVILTSGSHASAAALGLEAGLAVLCEKPLAFSLAEIDQLAQVQERTGGRLLLGYMKLYDPAVQEAKRVLDDPRAPVGRELRAIEVTVLHPSSESQLAFAHLLPPPTDVDRATIASLRQATDRAHDMALGAEAGPALGDLYSDILLGSVVHDLAVVRMLHGDPVAVDRVDIWPDGVWPPSLAIDARLDGGARLSIGWHYLPEQPAYREEVRLHYDRGSMELIFPAPYRLHLPTRLVVRAGGTETVREQRFESVLEAFEEQLFAFEALARDGTAPLAGIPDGRADVVTCQRIAAWRAVDQGMAIGGEAAAVAPSRAGTPS
jgi:myo-inositol 2-dehydrogenase / D-chiro-inositol 1-dehydrogenase